MWRETDAHGFLVDSFADTVAARMPLYAIRATVGVLYLAGAVMMCCNLWQTARHRVRPGEAGAATGALALGREARA